MTYMEVIYIHMLHVHKSAFGKCDSILLVLFFFNGNRCRTKEKTERGDVNWTP